MSILKILFIHNTYQHQGGEDSVLAGEQKLLLNHGHQCEAAIVANDHIRGISSKILTALQLHSSVFGHAFAGRAIERFHPDIVHVHNFFPLLTPAVYDACIESGVPVVQTLHNYRTICPGALLMRKGRVCEKCITASPYQAVLHRCYRHSVPGSWAVARMVAYHRRKQTWTHKVDRFIALTEFGRQKFAEAGFPADKIVVKPNFCPDARLPGGQAGSRKGALFVGRLSAEKGVATLLAAWERVDVPLRIAGSGSLAVDRAPEQKTVVRFLGQVATKQVMTEMVRASFLVMPSEWYEGFPMVLVEAFCQGLPVVTSRLGGMAEIVEDGVTGLHFEPGNPDDLVRKVQWLAEHPEQCQQMGRNARKVYEEQYTPERNYAMLMEIYRQAIAEHKGRNRQ